MYIVQTVSTVPGPREIVSLKMVPTVGMVGRRDNSGQGGGTSPAVTSP